MKNSPTNALPMKVLLLASFAVLWQAALGTSAAWAEINCAPCSQTPTPTSVCKVNGNSISDLINCMNDSAKSIICLPKAGTFTFTEAYKPPRYSDDNGSALPTVSRDRTICGNGSTLERRAGSQKFNFFYHDGGHLKIRETLFKNGSAQGINYGGYSYSYGGAIFTWSADARLTIENSTFTGNRGTYGGALYVDQGSVTITHSTFTGNGSSTTSGGAVNTNGSKYSTIIISSTFSENRGYSGSTALAFVNSPMGKITNSIVGGTCSGRISSGGHNLTTGSCLTSPKTTDHTATSADMKLADALRYHGGRTPTLALEADSPAIGNGDCSESTKDQRGVSRPGPNGACDIGAYQSYCHATISGNTYKITLKADFGNRGGALDGLPGSSPDSYALINSDTCTNDIPKNIDTIEWHFDAFSEARPRSGETFTIHNIFYTKDWIPSKRQPGDPPADHPAAGHCPSSQSTNCLNACIGAAPTPTPLTWPATPTATTLPHLLYTQPWNPQLSQNGNQLMCCAGNSCSGSDVENSNLLYYTIQWSSPVDSGDWDPRMCPRVVSTGPL